jgi:hypothetical protein
MGKNKNDQLTLYIHTYIPEAEFYQGLFNGLWYTLQILFIALYKVDFIIYQYCQVLGDYTRGLDW